MRAGYRIGMRWIPVLFLFTAGLHAQPGPVQGAAPGAEAKVELALLDYASSRDARDLARARELALRTVPLEEDPTGRSFASPEPLLRVAHAGGNTLREGERLLNSLEGLIGQMGERGTTDANAKLIRALFLYAQASESESILQEAAIKARSFIAGRLERTPSGVHVLPGGSQATEPSLLDYIETVGALIQVSSVAPEVGNAKLLNTVARDLVAKFWNEDRGVLAPHKVDSAMMGELAGPLLNARAVPALWFAGHATGDPFLSYRAKRIAKVLEKEESGNPLLDAYTKLALAIVRQPPIALVVVGNSGDPRVREWRKQAFFAFEPLKVILNLDPATDRARLAELHLLPGKGVSVRLLSGETGLIRTELEGREAIESACRSVRIRP